MRPDGHVAEWLRSGLQSRLISQNQSPRFVNNLSAISEEGTLLRRRPTGWTPRKSGRDMRTEPRTFSRSPSKYAKTPTIPFLENAPPPTLKCARSNHTPIVHLPSINERKKASYVKHSLAIAVVALAASTVTPAQAADPLNCPLGYRCVPDDSPEAALDRSSAQREQELAEQQRFQCENDNRMTQNGPSQKHRPGQVVSPG